MKKIESMTTTLFFHHYNDYSGSTRVLTNIIKEEYPNISDICVLTDNTNRGCLNDIEDLKIINVPILRFRGKAIPIISQIVWFIYGLATTLFVGKRYNTFYINTIIPSYGAVAGKILNKKIKYHIHEKYIKRSIKSWLSEIIFNHTESQRIFVSEYLKNQYPINVRCESIIKHNKLPKSFQEKIKITPAQFHQRKNIIIISSLSKGKGLLMFRDLAVCRPELNFTAVISSNQTEIEAFFGKDLPHNLTLIEKQASIHPFLRKSDLIVNLSDPNYIIETFGMTILEAMAYGLPAIVPDKGGPTEIVKNGINGFCVDVTNKDIILNQIDYCLQSKNYKNLHQGALKEAKKYMY